MDELELKNSIVMLVAKLTLVESELKKSLEDTEQYRKWWNEERNEHNETKRKYYKLKNEIEQAEKDLVNYEVKSKL